MNKEIFKDVPGYEGLYQVSNLGRVKSLERLVKFKETKKFVNERILKAGKSDGYYSVVLCNNSKQKSKRVHKLVAESFLEYVYFKNKLVVDHIDGNRLNNSLNNLQVITQRENCSKDKINKTSKYTGVHWSKNRNKWVAGIRNGSERIHLGYFKCELSAAKSYQSKLKEINQ